MHLVMFDVDGTLVDSHKFDADIYAQTIRDDLGIEVDRSWRTYANVTDSGILEELLDELAFTGDRSAVHLRIKNEFIKRTRRYAEQHPGIIREVAGARALIELLSAKASVRLAIATGGWHETAVLKLRAIGIDCKRVAMATATDATSRSAIMRLAEERCVRAGEALTKTYFGDGDWDKRASAELNYKFIGIGGRVQHDIAFADLSDHAAILAQLGV
jgi:phosphoglycolate phosphatase-like HAD superfamily hydrolase